MNRGIYVQKNSPHYWWRYYDKFDVQKKRKSHNTKIEITKVDLERIKNRQDGEKIKLQGTPELWRKIKMYKQSLADRNFERSNNTRLVHELLLSEGFAEFKKVRTVPGSKTEIKKKTLINYEIAVNHMMKACGDKKIYKYTAEKDFVALLYYFDGIRIPRKQFDKKTGEEVLVEKKMSTNSKSIYTRSLRALWNYFCEKNYAARNIIEPVEPEDIDPDPIPLDEMFTIIKYFEANEEYPHHHWLVYFLLLTGCRPSSAMVQLKEDVDLKQKVIRIQNVKTGKRKLRKVYQFPLYKELQTLLQKMDLKEGDTGRLFHQYKLNDVNYTYPLSFWERGMKILRLAKKIRDYYTLKQIRSTTASFLINVLQMKIYTVKKLLDHADLKITDKHYLKLNLKNVRIEMDNITIDDFLPDPNEFD
ncbi:MAG: tyrosine-type recombinase/integrase [Ignavibacteriales bacterium]|nr:tyrosine-type recombinase/integrase [Ignavibacteriales bacterium]